MSEFHRAAITTLLTRKLSWIDRTQRVLEGLLEREHPVWGDPGAEAEPAHEAALNTVHVQNNIQAPRNLSTEKIQAIRKRDREKAGLDKISTTNPLSSAAKRVLHAGRKLSLKPSSAELSRKVPETPPQVDLEVDPKDVSLPEDDSGDECLLQQPPVTSPASNSSCQTITSRSLAALMRRLDRCPITPSALEQLRGLREGTQDLLDKIDAAWSRHEAKLKHRSREWWWWRRRRRAKTSPGQGYEGAAGPGGRPVWAEGRAL